MFAFTVSAVVFTYRSIYGGYCRQREIRYRYVAKWQKRAFIEKTSDRKVIDDRPTTYIQLYFIPKCTFCKVGAYFVCIYCRPIHVWEMWIMTQCKMCWNKTYTSTLFMKWLIHNYQYCTMVAMTFVKWSNYM